MTLPDETISLVTGGLVALDKFILHAVTAVEDSTLLLSPSGAPSGRVAKPQPTVVTGP